MKYGIANKVNHYHAVMTELDKNMLSSFYPQQKSCTSDTGVFTMKKYPNENYPGGDWECQFPKSTTMIVGGNSYNEGPSCWIGGLNMNTSDTLTDCDFFSFKKPYSNDGFGFVFEKSNTA